MTRKKDECDKTLINEEAGIASSPSERPFEDYRIACRVANSRSGDKTRNDDFAMQFFVAVILTLSRYGASKHRARCARADEKGYGCCFGEKRNCGEAS